MFSKRKCPSCGTKNTKESYACIGCGALLASGQVKEQESQRSWFGKVVERLNEAREQRRDRTIDEVCVGLSAIGLEAQMVKGWKREQLLGYEFGHALGLIQINNSPIKYVNVIKNKAQSLQYYNVYVVPDTAMLDIGRLESVAVEEPRGINWKGNLHDVVVGEINMGKAVNNYLIRWGAKLYIYSYPIPFPPSRPSYWTICSNQHSGSNPPIPTRDRWDFYEEVARYLVGIHKNDSVVSPD